jgi:hypothetical protein
MLLTIGTTHRPATELGYLLAKHPDKCQTFSLAYGKAHVFYPEAEADRCTAALLLDVDPVGLVRGKKGAGAPLEQYVNDRPYVASSFLSVAIAQVYGTALSGKSKERPELAGTPIPLEARISVVPCRGGEDLLHYGPEYTAPENLGRLRARRLAHKRSLALRELALGIEALERFARGEPLRRVHECVFGVLALESEPGDPRL